MKRITHVSHPKNEHIYTGPERRKYKRVSVWTLARYKENIEGAKSKNAQIQNISEGGLLVKSKDEIPLGASLVIELYIPHVKGYHFIKPVVKSMWHKQNKTKEFWYTGTEFKNMDEESEKILTDFIRYFKDKAIDPHRNVLEEHYLHIPYWCIVKLNKLPQESSGMDISSEHSFGVIFENKENIAVSTNLELELKLPTIKMPFKVQGSVLHSKEIKKDSNYSIYLQLKNLTKDLLESIKKFAQE